MSRTRPPGPAAPRRGLVTLDRRPTVQEATPGYGSGAPPTAAVSSRSDGTRRARDPVDPVADADGLRPHLRVRGGPGGGDPDHGAGGAVGGRRRRPGGFDRRAARDRHDGVRHPGRAPHHPARGAAGDGDRHRDPHRITRGMRGEPVAVAIRDLGVRDGVRLGDLAARAPHLRERGDAREPPGPLAVDARRGEPDRELRGPVRGRGGDRHGGARRGVLHAHRRGDGRVRAAPRGARPPRGATAVRPARLPPGRDGAQLTPTCSPPPASVR